MLPPIKHTGPISPRRQPVALSLKCGQADEPSASKRQEDFSTYPEEERAVLRMASERGEFTRRDVEQLLACGSTKAKAIVGALLEKGAISSKGASRSTRYTLSGE